MPGWKRHWQLQVSVTVLAKAPRVCPELKLVRRLRNGLKGFNPPLPNMQFPCFSRTSLCSFFPFPLWRLQLLSSGTLFLQELPQSEEVLTVNYGPLVVLSLPPYSQPAVCGHVNSKTFMRFRPTWPKLFLLKENFLQTTNLFQCNYSSCGLLLKMALSNNSHLVWNVNVNSTPTSRERQNKFILFKRLEGSEGQETSLEPPLLHCVSEEINNVGFTKINLSCFGLVGLGFVFFPTDHVVCKQETLTVQTEELADFTSL